MVLNVKTLRSSLFILYHMIILNYICYNSIYNKEHTFFLDKGVFLH